MAVKVRTEVLAVTVGCDACGSTLVQVPVPVAQGWLQGHRRPAVLTLDVRIDGLPSRWVRSARG